MVCGSGVCGGSEDGCSTSNLIVYIPDEGTESDCDDDGEVKARLAIIKIVGVSVWVIRQKSKGKKSKVKEKKLTTGKKSKSALQGINMENYTNVTAV